jgi:glycosyltransferase involved in cell wall biosynthesis
VRTLPHDRIVAHWLLPAAWPVAVASSAPLEVVVHGSDLRLFAALPLMLRRRIAGALLRRGAHVRCVSAELARTLTELEPLFARHLGVEPAAIDVSRAPPRDLARRELGVGPDARLVVVGGRLVASKRIDVALAGAELIPDADVVVLGDGPAGPELRKRFPAARFVGLLARERALAWLAAADVVLSTSEREGAPTLVREARALGTPVVSVRAGDVADWARTDPDLWVVG